MPINRIVIAGNLGRDPETRAVGDTTVCHFPIPMSTKRKGTESTWWFEVNAWGKLGDLCQNALSKGSGVVVDGLLECREFEGKDGPQKVLEIRATDVRFDRAGSSSGSAKAAGEGDDEVPFF